MFASIKYAATAMTTSSGGLGSPSGTPRLRSHPKATAKNTPRLKTPVAPTIMLYGSRRSSHQATTCAGCDFSSRCANSQPARRHEIRKSGAGLMTTGRRPSA